VNWNQKSSKKTRSSCYSLEFLKFQASREKGQKCSPSLSLLAKKKYFLKRVFSKILRGWKKGVKRQNSDVGRANAKGNLSSEALKALWRPKSESRVGQKVGFFAGGTVQGLVYHDPTRRVLGGDEGNQVQVKEKPFLL